VRIFDVDGNGQIDFREYASLHKFLLSMQQVFSMVRSLPSNSSPEAID
jgi:hypothetical protein